jgi:AcrR family transcriptional regulator
VRQVAARAGVDPALVHHYFGTKQRLFVAAMEFPVEIAAVFSAAAVGPPELVGERVVRAFVAIWDQPEVVTVAMGVLRSAATDPAAAAMLREFLTAGPLDALARALQVSDGRLRATLVGTQLVGLLLVRYVVRIEPIASLDADSLAGLIGPTITRYLVGDLGASLPGPVR